MASSTSMMKFDLPSIEKLNGSNYLVWKKKVELLLKVQGFMNTVSGESKRPDDTKLEEQTKWEMQDMQAQLVLLGVIDENQMLLVDSCTTSAEIWIKLKSLYEKVDPSSKVAAQTAFFGYTYDGTKTIVEHIAHVENLAKKLRDIGELVSEEAVMARLLHNLPETYSGLLNAWNFSAKEQQTLAKLTHELIREEARQTNVVEASTSVRWQCRKIRISYKRLSQKKRSQRKM